MSCYSLQLFGKDIVNICIISPNPVGLLTSELHLDHNSITLANNNNTIFNQALVRLVLL